MCCTIIELIFCLLLPPVAVLIARGCDIHFLLNIILTCLAWIPGVIHAIYICFYFEPRGTAYTSN